MMMRIFFLGMCLVAAGIALTSRARADSLPTYEDFRRVDRTRRMTGQMQTEELLKVTRIDPGLIARTVRAHDNDPQMLWAAGELFTDWPTRSEMYRQALAADGTNTAVALRFACIAIQHSEFELASFWLGYCELHDSDNTAPWLAEIWMLQHQERSMKPSREPLSRTTEFRDYSVEATRARIRLLEAAGYSAYSARRLGFSPESPVLVMIRDLVKPPIPDEAVPLLKSAAKSMQARAPFLLDEFVGQSIEGALMAMQQDAATSETVRFRFVEMEGRRKALQDLLASVDRGVADFATEPEMVQYFDNVLSEGEEAAMKDLTAAVRHAPSRP
jgi:hypothetical protein